MTKNSKKIGIVALLLIIAAISGYFSFFKKQVGNSQLSADIFQPTYNKASENGGLKTFKFDNFHGSTDISDKFRFQYPANWYNDGQYFSPQKIQFYNRLNAKAPIYFDLVMADIFDQTELKYQIDNSKKINADITGQIDSREFKKYDLIDYGSYGGESAGRVKIFVGPKIKIDNQNYFLVFYWEERPLAEYMPGNSIDVFDNMLLSLKFF